MTVQVQIPRVEFITDGVEVNFAFTFKTLSPDDIQVFLDGSDTPEDPASYEVVLDGDPLVDPDAVGDNGGIVTMNIAPGPGTLAVVRNTPLSQETDYTAFDPFPSETHETGLDKSTMAIQELQERVKALEEAP